MKLKHRVSGTGSEIAYQSTELRVGENSKEDVVPSKHNPHTINGPAIACFSQGFVIGWTNITRQWHHKAEFTSDLLTNRSGTTPDRITFHSSKHRTVHPTFTRPYQRVYFKTIASQSIRNACNYSDQSIYEFCA
ncbi:hypothetical protein EG68_01166 [Paragonimus skrjabini miyazakii]|uniref:Uncharacterized protein n=1 Tax=Paragonimus skrjabini miyazakii TaxID=59628 RepID=A0A8S9Z7D8_9TREM|nr:hypothetical protein EG68_01166 [Paragonimus skrjabini miyazakii]